MDYLVLSPPVCPPSEPPSGAFILASALSGHGYHTGFLDLSLEFYHRFFNENGDSPGLQRSLDYLIQNATYAPMLHRTAAGAIHRVLKTYTDHHPGWTLTAMDLTPPVPVHQPLAINQLLQSDEPFISLWESTVAKAIQSHRPKKVLVSIAYLSQLPAAISLMHYLRQNGIAYTAGGSLLRSLHATGEGFHLLRQVIDPIDVSNGASLLANMTERDFLSRLAFPQVISEYPYLSGRPVLPLTLSTGCFWSGCLFCPDRDMKYIQLRTDALAQFMSTIPGSIRDQRPVIHLLDSAMPPNRLRAFMPLAKSFRLGFYGFARPERRLTDATFLRELSESGCLMLQLGVESGNDALLNRFNKGIHPKDARRVLQASAEQGIRTYVYLLFGLPGETDMEREDTRQLINDTIDAVDFLNLSIFNLPRHCELSQRADEFNITVDKYAQTSSTIELYRPFTLAGSSESPRKSVRSFIANRFSADPKIRQAVLRTPKWFRAAHLAMMAINGRNEQD
ncbi:MAG: radical SAM protein [Deltaproteobacteria bacterium]|nr:radical SAM protein [Deltaproteobacteria bacterium]